MVIGSIHNVRIRFHVDRAVENREIQNGLYSTILGTESIIRVRGLPLQKQMWRRKKPTQPSETESKQTKNGVCMNCIKLLQENSQLKEQLAILQGEGKKKQYTIAPTLYTFYKNNVQKNRISR